MTRHAKQTGITIATIAICLTGAGLAEIKPAIAHHSYSTTYDSNNTQTITGIIQSVRYASPHVTIQVRASGNSGQVWTIDLPSPNRAAQRGLTQNFLKVGSTATIAGWRTRDSSNELGATRVTINNQTVQLR